MTSVFQLPVSDIWILENTTVVTSEKPNWGGKKAVLNQRTKYHKVNHSLQNWRKRSKYRNSELLQQEPQTETSRVGGPNMKWKNSREVRAG